MVAIRAYRVTQHSNFFPLFFRNRIQCIALYQLHNSQALLNLCHGYFSEKKKETLRLKIHLISSVSKVFSINFEPPEESP